MAILKIQLEINTTHSTEVQAITDLIAALSGKKELTVSKPERKDKKEPVIKDKKEIVEKPPTKKDTGTLDKLRLQLGKKVAEHREEIKEKLGEFDAKNLKSLDEKHYAAFKTFLTKL